MFAAGYTSSRRMDKTGVFQSHYDEETRGIVSRVYAGDIATFDYSFENDGHMTYQNNTNSATPSNNR